ncbi:MAG TPA: hypothetical protein VMU28_10705 [Terriglobales bacterium]|nr:hypothetical protein [Terriglobales bacterium]
MTANTPILISFSGMDGAGKSTQIEHLKNTAEQYGLKVEIFTFWDNVVVFSRYREGFVQKVLKSESGVGTPGKPVKRRDKNVRGWHLNLMRHILYGMDAMHLTAVIKKAKTRGVDVVVMDRYIHDELANLSLVNPLTRTYVRIVARLVPCPDIAFVLDADPELAYARKPEYPLEFLREVRAAYINLANLLGTITVVPALSLTEAKRVIEIAFRRILHKRGVLNQRGTWAA